MSNKMMWIVLSSLLLFTACQTSNVVTNTVVSSTATSELLILDDVTTETDIPLSTATPLATDTITPTVTNTIEPTITPTMGQRDNTPVSQQQPTKLAEQVPDGTAILLSSSQGVDIHNPRSPNNGQYYVSAAYARLETGVNVTDLPANHRWVMATVTLGNETGATVTVDTTDINLIGDDGERYVPQEMVERVNPQLLGAVLDAGDSVYGFALFALPDDVNPNLFEWCVDGNCNISLQSPINLQ